MQSNSDPVRIGMWMSWISHIPRKGYRHAEKTTQKWYFLRSIFMSYNGLRVLLFPPKTVAGPLVQKMLLWWHNGMDTWHATSVSRNAMELVLRFCFFHANAALWHWILHFRYRKEYLTELDILRWLTRISSPRHFFLAKAWFYCTGSSYLPQRALMVVADFRVTAILWSCCYHKLCSVKKWHWWVFLRTALSFRRSACHFKIVQFLEHKKS